MNKKITYFMPKKARKAKKKEPIKEEILDDFKIEQLFGSKTRARLLSLFLENPERCFYVRELTRRIDAQLNSVRRELQNLVRLGIVLEVEGTILDAESGERRTRRSEKKKFYQANVECSFFQDLRNIMKKSAVLMHRPFMKELQEKGRVDFLVLTGHFLDLKDAATDVLIVGELESDHLESAVGTFEKDIGREVNYTFMPKQEFLYRRDVKDRFLTSILQGEKVILIDELKVNV